MRLILWIIDTIPFRNTVSLFINLAILILLGFPTNSLNPFIFGERPHFFYIWCFMRFRRVLVVIKNFRLLGSIFTN